MSLDGRWGAGWPSGAGAQLALGFFTEAETKLQKGHPASGAGTALWAGAAGQGGETARRGPWETGGGGVSALRPHPGRCRVRPSFREKLQNYIGTCNALSLFLTNANQTRLLAYKGRQATCAKALPTDPTRQTRHRTSFSPSPAEPRASLPALTRPVNRVSPPDSQESQTRPPAHVSTRARRGLFWGRRQSQSAEFCF